VGHFGHTRSEGLRAGAGNYLGKESGCIKAILKEKLIVESTKTLSGNPQRWELLTENQVYQLLHKIPGGASMSYMWPIYNFTYHLLGFPPIIYTGFSSKGLYFASNPVVAFSRQEECRYD
jgi:hypothetical protein